MSTDLKSKTKEFINYLRSTDEYVTALAGFVQYLKTAEYDRSHVIAFDIEDSEFEFGEIFDVCDRGDSLMILDYGHFWKGEVEVTKNL